MEVDTRHDDDQESSDALLGQGDVKQEAVSPCKTTSTDGLGEVERLVYSYINADGRGVGMVRRVKGEGREFLQITDKQTDAQSYFSNLVVVVTVEKEGTTFRLLTSRHRRLVKEVTVAAGSPAEVGGQLRATLAYCLMESAADRYTECQGAFEEESFVGNFSVLDTRHLLVESSDAGVVYRARSCPALIPKEAGSVCEACSQLRTRHAQSIEQFEQEEEEEEDNMGMLSQYLEVSMEDGAEDHKPSMPESSIKSVPTWTPRTNVGILRQGLESNPMHAFKPKLSYKKLISMAIKDSHYKMLKLTDIYAWILARYPGFNANRTGFQNSVRHNLSLNKVFIKVNLPGVANNGKGNYWTINPKFEDSSNTLSGSGHRDPIMESRQLAQRLASVSPNLSVTPCSPQLSLPDKTGLKEEKKDESLDACDDDLGADVEPSSENSNLSITKIVGHDFSDGLVLDKPNFSYKELIMIAIFCEPTLQVCLNDIYLTIKHWFPYFQQRSVGLTWQNSVRHNLSLNKCFRRIAPALSPHRPNMSSSTKGGSWTFSEHDETWRRLVTTPKKWAELRTSNNGSSESLLHFLANRSPEFRSYVYTKIYGEGELQLNGSKEDSDQPAAICNSSEKGAQQPTVSKPQEQTSSEPVDLMSRGTSSPLTTPPRSADESSVEEESNSIQPGEEEKGEELKEGREEERGYGGDDNTTYKSTLGDSYLEETRKEAAASLEKESFGGYNMGREDMVGGGKDGYQGAGGGGGEGGGGVGVGVDKSGYHDMSSYMGVSNSYMEGAVGASRMNGGERVSDREPDHIVMSGECEIGEYPGSGYQGVQPRPMYQEAPRAHPGYQHPGYPPGYQAYLPHNVANLSQQHSAWHLGTR